MLSLKNRFTNTYCNHTHPCYMYMYIISALAKLQWHCHDLVSLKVQCLQFDTLGQLPRDLRYGIVSQYQLQNEASTQLPNSIKYNRTTELSSLFLFSLSLLFLSPRPSLPLLQTHNFKEHKFFNVWWELLQIVVSHVQGSQAPSQVGKVGRKGRADEVIVRQVENF